MRPCWRRRPWCAPKSANIFVPGYNLPLNLDPHQILDVSMTDFFLNAYDNLYRYEDNPAKMRPWLALSYTELRRTA